MSQCDWVFIGCKSVKIWVTLTEGVTVTTEPAAVYLSLGSNLGNREDNLQKTMELISHRLRLAKVSSIYDTAPVDIPQPRFLNMACGVSTTLPPAGLLVLLKGFELMLGRIPGRSGLPRPIDVDILFYGDMVLNSLELTIPHPKLAEREFVLKPLSEIAPDLVHPVFKKTIKELLANVAGKQGVIMFRKKE
jgi:2-amino-4-hydroxy-6-hydroxymethyldihydropteridine diphosphokinase